MTIYAVSPRYYEYRKNVLKSLVIHMVDIVCPWQPLIVNKLWHKYGNNPNPTQNIHKHNRRSNLEKEYWHSVLVDK